jgi:hypothetical protein
VIARAAGCVALQRWIAQFLAGIGSSVVRPPFVWRNDRFRLWASVRGATEIAGRSPGDFLAAAVTSAWIEAKSFNDANDPAAKQDSVRFGKWEQLSLLD